MSLEERLKQRKEELRTLHNMIDAAQTENVKLKQENEQVKRQLEHCTEELKSRNRKIDDQEYQISMKMKFL